MNFSKRERRQMTVEMIKRLFDEGKSSQEIAEIMNMSESTIELLKIAIY